jgi:DNA integrity scanning protein DisA with diadenylate cyclase activity
MLLGDAIEGDEELSGLVRTVNFCTILITRGREVSSLATCPYCTVVTVPDIHMTRVGQVKVALLICLAKRILERGDRVVCLTGIDGSSVIDTLMVLNLGTEPELFLASSAVTLAGQTNAEVFERILTLATQLAVEGREGRPVGTLFVLGDHEQVARQSRSLVLNPFHGYPVSCRNILDSALEETIKEFSALDGAFLIDDDGVVLAAGVQLLPTSQAAALSSGLGTRHAAAAAITASTKAVAICISHSTGTVTVFKSGEMIAEIHKAANGPTPQAAVAGPT